VPLIANIGLTNQTGFLLIRKTSILLISFFLMMISLTSWKHTSLIWMKSGQRPMKKCLNLFFTHQRLHTQQKLFDMVSLILLVTTMISLIPQFRYPKFQSLQCRNICSLFLVGSSALYINSKVIKYASPSMPLRHHPTSNTT